MSAITILLIIACYFLVILVISQVTGKNADNSAFFLGSRKSPWYIVAYGMIGSSISGVTFISVPGWVGDSQFSYMQMVAGYLAGYFIIANVLLPLYYRLQLTSIYTYLHSRLGFWSYKTGATFFLISRIIGTAFRLYLMASVLHLSVFSQWGIPFWVTVVLTLSLIWLYTFRGGIRTIIWTDTLQTTFMLLAVIISLVFISRVMETDLAGLLGYVKESDYSRIFFFDDWNDEKYFFKQFLSGAFIAIVMTGLDQDMMQKNLSCRNLREAKKNVYLLSLSLVPVNLLFLGLGAALYIFAYQHAVPIPERSDDLFPLIATQGYLWRTVSVFFIVGLVAAAYSSADGSLTALTTSFTVDILNTQGRSEDKIMAIRKRVHIAITLVVLMVILIFRIVNNQSVISAIFTVAGYTYGPLLGLYAFGLFTRWQVRDRWVPLIAIISPVICFILSSFSEQWLNGYRFGFELLVLNGLITFLGMILIKRR
ncbi:MAG: sodium:solute symporter [Bacteroides sp. SM23_62_1]|nr:MAG: sodium:solute symporter [Bacteroides sp. SM23_62_1]